MIFKSNICSFLLRRKKEPKRARLAGGAGGSIAGKFLKQYAIIMQRFFFAVAPLAMVMVFSVSCGAPEIEEVQLTGNLSVSAEHADLVSGPVFIAVAKTDSFDEIQNDPMNNIAVMSEADLSSGKYTVDLSDTGVKNGDQVFIFAFSDNDYQEGIPYPTPGDIVGFYVDSESLKTVYTIGSGGSPDLVLSRYHYNHKSKVIGVIEGNDSGSVILIAYAGDFNSTDFSALDVNAVVGYRKINKPAGPCTYSMNIMPYGFDVPLAGVYVIALLDKNGNGIPDDGDMIGFPSDTNESSYPIPVTINEGSTATKTIRFTMQVYTEPESDEPPLTLTVGVPEGYIGSDKPLYIIVAKGNDPNQIFENIRNINTEEFEFKKLEPDAAEFFFELSRRKFKAGDQIFVFALWDIDTPEALPRATEGDIVGFAQNRSAFSYTLTLQEYDNVFEKNEPEGQWYFNGEGGYEFNINRKYYNHSASMRFRLEKGDMSDALFANGNKVICMAVWETGTISTGYSIDMDKIIGVSNVTIQREIGEDYTIRYSLPVMPVLHQDIPARDGSDLSINNVWVLALHDANGNGKPDAGEKLGFYWDRLGAFGFYVYYPAKLTAPVGDGVTYLNKNVRFSNQSY
jgi:hypothetical protein